MQPNIASSCNAALGGRAEDVSSPRIAYAACHD